MRELVTYSIETDQTVLLIYNDGLHRRIPVAKLRQYVTAAEAEKISSSLKLRQHFLEHHMPKAVFALAAGGMCALFGLVGRPVALWWTGANMPAISEPTAAPASQLVRTIPDTSAADPTPSVPPTLSPSVPPAPLMTPRPGKTSTAKRATPAVQHVVKRVGNVAGLNATPTPTSTPLAVAPTPVPAPDHGEVLGDSTGPDITPSPTPLPTLLPEPSPGP